MSNGDREAKKSAWPWVLLGCGICAFLAIPIVAIVAAVAIPSLLAARRGSLETNAVGSCRAYCSAQTMYKRNDWDGNGVMEYAVPYTKLSTQPDSGGMPINLIDAAFAAANGPNGMPKHGYRFQDMKTIGGSAIDWTSDYGLSALPAVYGRSGYRSFIVATNGTVFGLDQGSAGGFVQDYPAEPMANGWILAE
jgi:type II secretory pathway pseudopilin PulG